MFLRFLFCRSLSLKASDMVKVLNVAEKNDAAKSIAEVMSRGRYQRREGFSRFNKIYEYDYRLLNQNCAMVMTSVSGHLLGLEFVGQYRKWNSCSPVALFDVPVEKYCPENFQDIKRTLEREVRGSQFLVIWTDCDREGENIGFEVIQVCKAVKPNLQVYRAKFSEITPQAIERACRALIAPDKRTNDAVDVRMELDLRIGAAFTRFQTKRLQKIFPGVLADQLISYGSCQFPTLGFVVERYKQVQAFIPEPFWKLKVLHKMEEGTVEFSWKRNRLFDYMACFVLYEHCVENPVANVLDVKGRSKSKWRPTALDTVELEKLASRKLRISAKDTMKTIRILHEELEKSASRKLRISAKDTMKIAEKLYTQGFISYPRTETNQFPKELDLVGMCQAQTQDPNWGEFAQRVLERGPTPRNGNKTDNAHPPIHPTKYTNNLQGDEKKIYEFIVRHFLACCSQDAQGFETTVEITVADEMFSASGLMITARNYLDVYIYEKWNAKQIPVFTKGDEFEPTAIEMNSGETSPPSLLTEADLIALMDKHGIGTDATHAEHIETIKSRSYVGVRQDGRLVPGQLGMGLVEGYDAMGYEMSKPHLRSELEADLKKICEGTKQKQVVLEAQVKKYKEVFIEACKQAIKIDEALSQYLGEEAQQVPANEEGENLVNLASPVLKCPLCGLDMLLKPKKDNKGFYIGCMGFPDCRSAVWLPESVVEATVSDQTCQRCGPSTHKVNFKFKRGSVPPTVPLEYSGCIVCDSVLTEEVGIKVPRQQGGPSQRYQAQIPDSGYGSNSSFNSTGSRSMSTQAGQRNIADMFSPNTMRVTSGSRNSNSQANRTTGSNSSSFHTSNSHSNSNNSRNMNGLNNSGNYFNNTPVGRGGGARQPLAVVTGNARNSGNNFNQSRGGMAGNRGGMTGNSRNYGNNLNQSGGSSMLPVTAGGDGDENKIVCNCGNDALQLTVRKEGPNTGRQFYKCGSSSCSFFLWADEAGTDNTGGSDNRNRNYPSSNVSNGYQSSYNRNTSSTGNRHWDQNSGADNSVQCECGQPAKSLTVQKEGPNKGRPFYACPAPRGQGCNYFQWADDDSGGGGGGFSSGGSGQGGRGRGRGRGGGGVKRSSSEGGAPAKKRKCGYCNEEGHNRRNCPLTRDT